MKKINKIITAITLSTITLAGATLLAGCGNHDNPPPTTPTNPTEPTTPSTTPTFTSNSTIKASTEQVISNLYTKVYNNEDVLGKKQTYTMQQINTIMNENITYYIEVGTFENISEISNIELGNITYNKNDDISLSIGNSNFIKDKAFKVVENKLFIACPIVAFETVSNNTIKINGQQYNLNNTPANTMIEIKEVKFVNANSLNSVEQNNNGYDITLSNANYKSLIGVYYNGASSNDIVISKKLLNGDLNNFGFTGLEPNENNPLGLYLTNYTDDFSKVNEKFDDANWNYQAYVVGKGIINTNFHVTLNK